jgi:putative DNA primase/helicase
VNIKDHFKAIKKQLGAIPVKFLPELGEWWMHQEHPSRWIRATEIAELTVMQYALKHFPDKLPGRFVREALAYASSDDALRKSFEEFDAANGYVNTPGGGIKLADCSQLEPTHPWPFTMSLRAMPALYGEGSDWGRFLAESIPDEASRRWLQMWAGSLLSGSTEHHALLFIYGPGGTGKSVFAEVLMHALGDYSCVLPAEVLMGRQTADAAYWKATLKGKRLAVVNETGEGDYWNAPQVKALTGGDTVHARNPYGRPFAFQPTHKILVVSNDPPHLGKVDDAWKRRMVVLPFLHKPASPDPTLKSRLMESAAEVLGWALEGWNALHAVPGRSLLSERPESILEATDAYLEEVDTVGEWIEECCDRYADARCTPTEVYASYRRYCESIGKKPKSWANVRHDLAAREGISVRKSNGKREVIGMSVRRDTWTDPANF